MVAIALIALAFAAFGVIAGGLLAISIPVVIFAFGHFPVAWKICEIAATVSWLLGAVLEFSDVNIDGLALLFFLATGYLLASSWALRESIRWSTPESRNEWISMLSVPASLLLALTLMQSDWDLRLRLNCSESALRAEVRRIPRGHKEILRGRARRVGLFWVNQVEEVQGCIFWKTGALFMDSHGLAYIPGAMPSKTDYEFRHIRGPWWTFVFHF